MLDQALQDGRPVARNDLAAQRLEIDVAPFSGFCKRRAIQEIRGCHLEEFSFSQRRGQSFNSVVEPVRLRVECSGVTRRSQRRRQSVKRGGVQTFKSQIHRSNLTIPTARFSAKETVI